MTNRELLQLNLNLLVTLKGVKLAYAIVRNVKLIKNESESLREAQPAKFKEFEEARVKLAESMSKKDENGKSVIVNNGYQIDNVEGFSAKLKILQEEYKDVIAEYDVLLNAESDINFYKIKLEYLPDDITVQQMAIIVSWIEED